MALLDTGDSTATVAIAADQPIAAKMQELGGAWCIAIWCRSGAHITLRYTLATAAHAAWPRIEAAIAANTHGATP